MKLRANAHTHTTFCDGKNSVEEMTLAAIERGFVALGFSMHGWTPYETTPGLSLEREPPPDILRGGLVTRVAPGAYVWRVYDRETATALRGRLAALFDAPPQAVQQVMDLLQALADGLEQAANAQSAVRLGAQIKYCQLLCAVGMADYAAALAP